MLAAGLEPHSLGDLDALQTSDEIAEAYGVEHIVTVDHTRLIRQAKGEKDVDLFMIFWQEHENDVAEVVLVSEPEGASNAMGGLHPRASLYERPLNLDACKEQHAEFRRILRSHGIKGRGSWKRRHLAKHKPYVQY